MQRPEVISANSWSNCFLVALFVRCLIETPLGIFSDVCNRYCIFNTHQYTSYIYIYSIYTWNIYQNTSHMLAIYICIIYIYMGYKPLESLRTLNNGIRCEPGFMSILFDLEISSSLWWNFSENCAMVKLLGVFSQKFGECPSAPCWSQWCDDKGTPDYTMSFDHAMYLGKL